MFVSIFFKKIIILYIIKKSLKLNFLSIILFNFYKKVENKYIFFENLIIFKKLSKYIKLIFNQK